jgi:tetratricopeptide (TPR) repeat protein
LASLGLALAASGDDEGADDAVKKAEQAGGAPWAGTAAAADLRVMRAASRTAGRRFRSLPDVVKWLGERSEKRAGLDDGQMSEAARQYDAAVAGVEKSGARGHAAVSVYWRRRIVPAAWRRAGRGRAGGKDVAELGDDGFSRKAAELVPDDPFVLTMLALDDAMSERDADGARHVEKFERLPKAAQDTVDADLGRLAALAESADAETAARALQGTACLQWFCRQDAAATEATLHKSIARDPHVEQSWKALVLVLSSRWDEVAKLCEDWIKVGDAAGRRMVLANALFQMGRAEDAEKHWRVAQSLDPKSFAANLGVAVLVLRRFKDDADLAEASRHLRAASVALAEPDSWGYWWGSTLDAAAAVRLGLTGDLDGAEIAARRMLASDAKSWQAREILWAIGR